MKSLLLLVAVATALSTNLMIACAQELSSGDRALSELRSSETEVVQIWPGNGTRDDDPASDLLEKLPEKPDGLVRITNVSRPTMHVWRAKNPDGRAVVVFPGGAYNGLAAQHEGTDIAGWCNQQGITAFVVKYRVPRRAGFDKHAVALQDAQRAIRLVRSNAKGYGIDPGKIGVIGFSAGGNLATLTVHLHATESYESIDEADQCSPRPDFAMLIYPAYLIEGDKTTKQNKLDPALLSLAKEEFPPMFMAVAGDDRFAPDSLHYMLHLHQLKVPAALHVYRGGGHGKGLRELGGPFARWTHACQQWLDDHQE
ncbi:MAG: alpha/beta hydrolase [Rubripirellula sp.]